MVGDDIDEQKCGYHTGNK
ncbi:hypothetical protein YPPY01_2322, partial [Yersinia pestis PY-01]